MAQRRGIPLRDYTRALQRSYGRTPTDAATVLAFSVFERRSVQLQRIESSASATDSLSAPIIL